MVVSLPRTGNVITAYRKHHYPTAVTALPGRGNKVLVHFLLGWCTSCSGKRQSRAETSAPPENSIRLIRLIRCFLQAAGIRLISCEINAPNESVKIRAICGSLLSASGFRGRFFLLGWCTYCSVSASLVRLVHFLLGWCT